jgi:phage terminase large subunit-like protein
MTAEKSTAAWVRNRSDELAAADGYSFDVDRGSYAVWWIERHCRLYEGEQAGEALVLRGCHQCHRDPEVAEEWTPPAVNLYRKRAERHCLCVAAGHTCDWQYDVTMRMFGWVRYAEKWKRPVRRFTEASIWVAKKNKKSPTLAAWGLYLFCGDGEPGQKVFIGAKDGRQAREVAGKHVVEMYLKNEELQRECSLNQNSMQLTHLPSRSTLLPLSSSNTRTKQAKEGINGSVIIDETHVVDEEFIGIISRAGISRSEPLRIEVSTAGDNPDGYGKQRFDLAVLVEQGRAVRPEMLVAIYAAPQDVKDEDLALDPLKFGRMANPAMGHTVDPDEFLRDYENSKVSLAEFARFKKYRLDIWQRAANPWLKPDDWARCAHAFAAEDLRGLVCWAGLDLSKTRDLTAIVYVFPWDEGYRVWPRYFMPEQTARERNDKVPFLAWARAGFITLTPGGTCDYGFVRKQFREDAELFDVRQLLYDPWQAEETTQSIEQGVVVEGVEIEKGTGVERVLFKQTLANFAGPTEEFEKLVIDARLQHPDSPVMNWQAGHVTVYMDANRNKRPIKPKVGDIRSIDGLVAGIMGLAGAEANKDQFGSPRVLLL